MNQNSGNFAYDLIGNLVKDKAMEVASMSWTAYHKREKVIKEDGTTITYRYDAMNNRIYKKAEGNGVTETTHYLRDGTGNTLAIYKNGILEELNIYGSSRIGTYNGKTDEGKRTLGNKRYELSNHLGNALVVITDNKLGKDTDNNQIADTYIAMVVSERDYLAFGAVMHKRSYENEDYTYSFNGKELDKSTGWQDYGFRDYNPVYKRFDSVDPLTQKYPELTPYQFASNSPISGIDLDGLEYSAANIIKKASNNKELVEKAKESNEAGKSIITLKIGTGVSFGGKFKLGSLFNFDYGISLVNVEVAAQADKAELATSGIKVEGATTTQIPFVGKVGIEGEYQVDVDKKDLINNTYISKDQTETKLKISTGDKIKGEARNDETIAVGGKAGPIALEGEFNLSSFGDWITTTAETIGLFIKQEVVEFTNNTFNTSEDADSEENPNYFSFD